MAVEEIGFRLVVKDDGTAVVQKHVNTTNTGLQTVQKEAAKTTTAVERTTKAVVPLSTTLEKSKGAAMALAGGLSGVGGRAAMATSAISQLVFTGLNPLGVALAGVSVALGVMVSKYGEAEEAAKALTAAQKAMVTASRENQIALRASIDPEGARQMEMGNLRAEIARLDSLAEASRREAMRQAEVKRAQDLRGMGGRLMEGGESPAAKRARLTALSGDALLTEYGISDGANTYATERAKVMDRLVALEGRRTAELAEQARLLAMTAEQGGLEAALAELTGNGQGALKFGGAGGSEGKRDAFFARLGADGLADPFAANRLPDDTSTAGIVAEMEARIQRTQMERQARINAAIVPQAADQALGELNAAAAARAAQEAPWRDAGRSVGLAYTSGISSVLSDAAMGRGLDLQRFATSMADTFIRGLMDAFSRAAFEKPLTSAFERLFMGIGGMGGGGGGGSFSAPGGGSSAMPHFNTGQSLTIIENKIAPDGVLLQASPRVARNFVAAGSSSPVRRGGRA